MDSTAEHQHANVAARFVSRDFARPRVVMSACLELEECRFDGRSIPDPFVARLIEHVDLVPICPEMEIGLGVPRDTIRLVHTPNGEARLVQPSTNEDLTERMTSFADWFLGDVGAVDGFILKSSSPSCGLGDAKVYAGIEKSPVVRSDSGLFAAAVTEHFPLAAVESEGRLRNYPIRHHFLTQLFTFAEFRALPRDTPALTDFQRRHKHLYMTYDQPRMRQLGAIAADSHQRPIEEAFDEYREVLGETLNDLPAHAAYVNSLAHMYSHFRRQLPEAEAVEFRAMLDEFRDHRLPLHALLAIVRSWCSRFQYEYFADQSLLEPYPRAMLQMRDSGKGIDF